MAEVNRNPHPRQNPGRSEAPEDRRESKPATLESRVLLGPDGRVLIRHREQTYELRETRFGKLILTK
jgi:hemin uptake protein HemP